MSSSSAFINSPTAVAVSNIDASKCAWKQVTGAGTCYIEPRSCYDCLNTAISGKECVLTPFGLCEDISAYEYSEDYRRPQSAFTYPIHYNYFPEANTTYCERNDSVCNSCQETTFTVGNKNPSIYCTGKEDCVCIAICESETWFNETLARLAALLRAENETTTCPLAANSSSNFAPDSASASKSLTVPASKDVYAADDECMWYQNSTYCETPRTCYDCLNTGLYSGQKCTISPGGYCTTMDTYNYTLDYRGVYSDSAAHYFPSTNTTYCEYDDATCMNCRTDTFVSAYAGRTKLSAYCVGENDCVCVAFCESPNWESIVVEKACEATLSIHDSASSGISSVGIASIVVVGVLFALSVILQFIKIFHTRRRDVRWQNLLTQSIGVRRQPTTGLSLELCAWKEMRDDIIADQRDVGDGEFIGPRFADVLNNAPTVTVEEGDGYRPMSPSVSVLPASPPLPSRSFSVVIPSRPNGH